MSTLSGRQQSKHSVQAIEQKHYTILTLGENVAGASSSPLDIYTKVRQIPNVGAFPLMTKHDNERDVVVPDPSLVSALPDLRSDRLCPITYCIRLRQLASSYWIVSFSTDMFKD